MPTSQLNKEFKKKNILIRRFKPGDLEGIAELFNKEYGDNRLDTYESFKWQLLDNPCQPQVAWIAYDTEKEQVAAYYQLLIQHFYVGGQNVLAGLSVNTLVDKSYRNFLWRDDSGQLTSLFLFLANLAYEEANKIGISFIWIIPNEISAKGFMGHLGFKEVQKLTLGIRPIKPGLILQHYISHPGIGRIIGSVADWATNILFPNFSLPKDMMLRQLSIYDLDEAESVAKNAEETYTVYQPRNKEFLSWRYFNSPRSYRMYGLYNREGVMLAWCVTSVMTKGNASLRRYQTGMIVDLCCPQTSAGLRLGRILLRQVSYILARESKVALILVLYNASLHVQSPYKKYNFIVMPRKYESRKFSLGVKVFNKNLLEILSSSHLWQIYFGDYDVV